MTRALQYGYATETRYYAGDLPRSSRTRAGTRWSGGTRARGALCSVFVHRRQVQHDEAGEPTL